MLLRRLSRPVINMSESTRDKLMSLDKATLVTLISLLYKYLPEHLQEHIESIESSGLTV